MTDNSDEGKMELSPSCSFPKSKRAKFTIVDNAGIFVYYYKVNVVLRWHYNINFIYFFEKGGFHVILFVTLNTQCRYYLDVILL